VGLFDAPPGSFNVSKHAVNASTPQSMATAKQLVTDSAVLIKNSGGALPLLKPSAQAHPSSGPGSGRAGVAVFGLASKDAIYGGTGSGSVVPSNPISPWAGITSASSPLRARGFTQFSDHTADSIAAASKAAAAAEVAIVFVGTRSGEGADRPSLGLGKVAGGIEQDQLVTAVCGRSTRCIVVVSSPGAVLLPWARDPAVSAIIAVFMPGQVLCQFIYICVR
jgi:beta-glucosidase